jgi:hypothetical protein
MRVGVEAHRAEIHAQPWFKQAAVLRGERLARPEHHCGHRGAGKVIATTFDPALDSLDRRVPSAL